MTADFAPEQVTAAAAAYNTLTPHPGHPRTHTQVSALFGVLPLVPPGVVKVTEWRPSLAEPLPTARRPLRRPGPHSGTPAMTMASA